MAEVKQSKTEAAKINDRLRNDPSGRPASTTVTTSPTRTVTNIYHSGSQAQHGPKENGNG